MTAWAIGCVPATIYRADDRPLDAIVESSDATTLRVRDQDGNRFALGQRQVAEIDHPGNAGAVVGLVMTALGATILAATSSGSSQRPVGYVVAAGGLFNVVFGLTVWVRSRRAAHAFAEARPSPPPSRAVFPDPPGLR